MKKDLEELIYKAREYYTEEIKRYEEDDKGVSESYLNGLGAMLFKIMKCAEEMEDKR